MTAAPEQSAFQAKPWVHITVTGPGGQTSEAWFSPAHQVSASRHGGNARFHDLRLGIEYSYDSEEKQLIRSADYRGRTRKELEQFRGILEAIFRGREEIDSPLLGSNVVEQKRRRVTSDGKTWVEHELLLEDNGRRSRVVFHVDPETLLPESMKLVPLDECMPEATCHFDYPEEGPADIYALGVPPDVELVDRVPKADVERLIQGVDDSRRRFPDSYYVIVIDNSTPGDDPMGVCLNFEHFWRKAGRWRKEESFPFGPKVHEAIRDAGPPAPGEDLTAWRRKWPKDVKFFPRSVCDGEAIYKNTGNFHGRPKWDLLRKVRAERARPDLTLAYHCVVEHHAYPDLFPPSHQFEAELIEDPDEGPPGTVLYQVRPTVKDSDGHPWQRYWIDPTRSYVTLRYEQVAPDGEPSMIFVMEGLRQTPNGIWYPTIVRRKIEGMESVSYFYVDFRAELPDSLFKPADRPADD